MSQNSTADIIKEYYPQYYGKPTYPADRCVTIHKVKDEWGIFCNFARTPLVVDGVTFKSSEELFQYMKFKDATIVERIAKGVTRNNKVCHEIKRTVKSYEKEHQRDDWSRIRFEAMKFCLQTKYEQSEEFRSMLQKSVGFYIVEDQTTFRSKKADTWGVKLDGDNFVGPNMLGKLLMELRDNGKLEYSLPDDAFDFIQVLKSL